MDKLDPVFDAVASYFAVLAEPARLKIMHAICERERSVNEIVRDTGIPQSNVSRHLGLMYRQGVVERRRDGNQIYYQVADETMPELCRAVCARIAKTMDERRPMRRQLLQLVPATRRTA
jgi:DNA-binding transcriptional ArsR family regulator